MDDGSCKERSMRYDCGDDDDDDSAIVVEWWLVR